MTEKGQAQAEHSSNAGDSWLEKTLTIAQMLYEEPSVGPIPLDLHSACAVGNYDCVQEAVNRRQDLSTRNKGKEKREWEGEGEGRILQGNFVGRAVLRCTLSVILPDVCCCLQGVCIQSEAHFALFHVSLVSNVKRDSDLMWSTDNERILRMFLVATFVAFSSCL